MCLAFWLAKSIGQMDAYRMSVKRLLGDEGSSRKLLQKAVQQQNTNRYQTFQDDSKNKSSENHGYQTFYDDMEIRIKQ